MERGSIVILLFSIKFTWSKESCEVSGFNTSAHFADVGKIVEAGASLVE